jgi:hypothetical protein
MPLDLKQASSNHDNRCWFGDRLPYAYTAARESPHETDEAGRSAEADVPCRPSKTTLSTNARRKANFATSWTKATLDAVRHGTFIHNENIRRYRRLPFAREATD